MRILESKKRWYLWALVALVSFLVLIFAGCGDDDEDAPEESQDPLELTQQGWWDFEDQYWQGAQELFHKAYSLDDRYSDAYAGEGWSYFKMGEYTKAKESWNAGKDKIGDINDIRAGLAMTGLAQGNYDICVTNCNSVISSNLSWTLGHESGLNVLDLHWALAQTFYLQDNFTDALEEVQILNPNFDISLPDGSVIYDADTVYALAQEIERLQGIVRG